MNFANNSYKDYKQNLHTHTTFCDGKDSPEELVCEALARGFDSLGFSIHSFMRGKTIDSERLDAYKTEILRLKEKYGKEIALFLGIEFEPWTELQTLDFDYTITALHYLPTPDGYKTFDVNLEGTLGFINNYFNGDAQKFAKAYYETLCTLPEHGSFDILAHFDIITKHNEAYPLFDADSKQYMDIAIEAADALAGKIPFFEVNTGAIARGYRTSPYPSLPILKELKARGFGAVITSDCHNKNHLDCSFSDARELLRAAGFNSKFILTDKGFKETAL